MKNWKCPHCESLETSKEDIVMVLCPNCVDCNMEEIETKKKLATVKPKDFTGFLENGKQICMRCSKKEAKEGDIFCQECINDRKKIDDNVREISKIEAEKKKKEDGN